MPIYLPKPYFPRLNRSLALAKGFVVVMPFHEQSIQGRRNDLSGYENHGTMTGGAIGKSPYGYALEFDGDDDQMDITDRPSLAFTTEFTLHCLLNPNYSYKSGCRTISKWGTVGKRSWLLHLITDGSFYLALSSNGTSYYVATAGAGSLTENVWQTITCTYKAGDGVNIWLDAVDLSLSITGNEGLPASLFNSTIPIQIGRDYDDPPANYWYKGLIANFGLANRKLDPIEISQLHHDSFSLLRSPFNPYLYYPFPAAPVVPPTLPLTGVEVLYPITIITRTNKIVFAQDSKQWDATQKSSSEWHYEMCKITFRVRELNFPAFYSFLGTNKASTITLAITGVQPFIRAAESNIVYILHYTKPILQKPLHRTITVTFKRAA